MYYDYIRLGTRIQLRLILYARSVLYKLVTASLRATRRFGGKRGNLVVNMRLLRRFTPRNDEIENQISSLHYRRIFSFNLDTSDARYLIEIDQRTCGIIIRTIL